ncbi:SRPBCC family protein [Arthrobacter ginkgonis]|uniref:SRPBCC family protein n=1 Tax=Arthrobacter ginkgonis TaxID=1630594 RepID=A0ABP7C9H7_9MICC
MARVQESIEVDVPVQTAYNQWTQFESFPEFMTGVESVVQQEADTSHWVTRVGGVQREFDTRIVEQVPDQLIHWRSTDNKAIEGIVRFEPLAADAATRPAPGVAEETPGVDPGLPRVGMPGDDMAGSPIALDPDMQTRPTGTADPYATVPAGARTRVTVDFTWDDETFMEKAGAALGFDSAQVKRDLHRFREFIEERGSETGAWRGSIDPTGPLG